MKEHPIIMQGESVRAILDGTKTQTRRVIKYIPYLGSPGDWCHRYLSHNARDLIGDCSAYSPYGKPGDQLWVREKHMLWRSVVDGKLIADPETEVPVYQDDPGWEHLLQDAKRLRKNEPNIGWEVRPSIHMPRWASRITLEVTGVRVERCNEISEEDAIAEGMRTPQHFIGDAAAKLVCENLSKYSSIPAIHLFAKAWDSINAKRGYSWDKNLWCWVIEFRRVSDD